MESIGAFEAKTHLAALLDRVAKGERITITRHGIPAAVLVPPPGKAEKLSHGEIVAGMRELRGTGEAGGADHSRDDRRRTAVLTVVLDASTTLAWCFPDEASDYADDVLVELEGKSILVPEVWGLEIANAILTGERKKRLKPAEVRRFLELLGNLQIVEDRQPAVAGIDSILPLAREHNLSAYDASYLALAVRQRTALATMDAKLITAAKRAGISIFGR